MQRLLDGKNALITGTARGIGAAILEQFAKEGANIWAHARIETPEFIKNCEMLSSMYKVNIEPVCFDLTDEAAMKECIKRLVNQKIPVHILVNNAGITNNSLLQMTKMEVLRQQMEVNFFAPYQLTQLVLRIMIKNKTGTIINIASTAAEDGNSGKSAYGASKAAFVCMTKSLAAEVGKTGIRANCIAPGMTSTEMLQSMPEYIIEETKKSVDLRRVGETKEIAKVAVFLASDLASYVTGQVLRVDGGM